MRIVITKFREFTDVIMTVPVIYSACVTNPAYEFILVTRTSLTELFVNPPSNLKVEGLDINGMEGVTGAWHLWKVLRDTYSPDRLVCLNTSKFFAFVALLARLGGCKASSLRPAPGFRRLIRRNNKIMLPLLSTRARYREALFRVGVPVQEHFHGLFGPGGHGDAALFASITPPPAPGEIWIGVAPFAKHRGKAYPPELMEDVIGILEKEIPQVKIILFGGGEKEIEILTGWAERHPSAISPVQARLGFQAELSLLSYLDVLITMDSANMHLASLVGVPVLTLWGATHPYCGFKGWHQKESATIQLPMPCRPCSLYGDKECHRGDYHCLTAIKPRFIADKVKECTKNR